MNGLINSPGDSALYDKKKVASVSFTQLNTLWFNTGSLCNLTCEHCFMKSSPLNDRLSFLSLPDMMLFLNESQGLKHGSLLIGLTGGEPFINPEIISLIEAPLKHGHSVLILSNAYKVIERHKKSLLTLLDIYGKKLSIRVSLDHYKESVHDKERGKGTFTGALNEIKWLIHNGFSVSVASRTLAGTEGLKDSEAIFRKNFQNLFDSVGILLNATSESELTLFAEMNENAESIRITEGCWSILGKSPNDQMCSDQRMVVKRRDQKAPEVVACTLIPYSDSFSLGESLEESFKDVELSHPYCAQFCVLGGSRCR